MRKKSYILSELTHENTINVSYLFGTMHSADAKAFTFFKQAVSLLKGCSTYAGEMDLGSVDNDMVMDAFTFQEEKTLVDFIGEKKYEKYKALIKRSFDFDLDVMNQFTPMYILSILTSKVLSNDHPLALDHALYQEALNAGLITKGIESNQEQFEIAKKISIDIQLSMLKSTLKNVTTFRSKIKNLASNYQHGDIIALHKDMKKPLMGVKNILLKDRNIIMAARISELCYNNASFCSLGAGHLSGKNGIIHLLKENGWKIKPLGEH